jgi:N-acetylglutamate synthase-like GNAT family acetyltransferase
MEDLKIKKIKNLNKTKEIFNFISSSFFRDSVKFGDEFIPLHELYDVMLDNLTNNRDFQFYGVYEKTTIATVVASILPYDPACLLINVLFVNGTSRERGFAKRLLQEIEMIAKQKGFERIRAVYTDSSSAFFKKYGYDLSLELAIPETHPIEEVIKINNLNLVATSILRYHDINFVQYDISEPDIRIKNYIHRNTPLVKAVFFLEKEI